MSAVDSSHDDRSFLQEFLPNKIAAGQATIVSGKSYVPGEILVGFAGNIAEKFSRGPQAGMEAAEKLVGHVGLQHGRVLTPTSAAAGGARVATQWQLPPGMDVMAASSQLLGLVGIAYAEPNWIYQAAGVPDDSRFAELWGLHNTGQTGGATDADIDAPEAWNIATGNSNVVVGVIDTGVDYTHVDLATNVWTNPGEIPGDGIDNDANGFIDDYYGYDFVGAGDSDPMDDNGHGTHVSGSIAAVGDNSTGVAGVNWNAKVMALKFLNADGSGSTADAVEAVNYASMMRGRGVNIALTSNSWGGGGFSQALQDAIASSGQANMLFVAAAGNGNTDTDVNVNYPSGYPLDNIISVAATDHNDARASFSNWGATTVDLAAPGVSILSTTPGNTYSSYNGTSMATPHVAGVAALAWGIASGASYSRIRDAILDGVDPVASMAGVTTTGGRLNAYRTLQHVGMSVLSSTPASGSVVTSKPTDFVVNFSFPLDCGSVTKTDLAVNGASAESVTCAGSSVTFHFDPSQPTIPIQNEGVQTIAMAAGAVQTTSGIPDDPNLQPWTSTFRYDAHVMEVSATVPANGSIITLPTTTLTVKLTEKLNVSSVGIDDLVINQGIVKRATAVDGDDADSAPDDAAEYVLEGITQEGTLTVNMAAGAIVDTYGNPMAGYGGSFGLDFGTTPLPGTFHQELPEGSLIYQQSMTGFIGAPGDTDHFVFDVDPGQRIAVVVTPGSTLTPTVSINGPGIALQSAAGGQGQKAVIQAVGVTSGGTYTIEVGGVVSSGAGAYSVQVIVNAVVEQETNNGVGAAAQNIDGGFLSLGAGASRAAVLGQVEDNGATQPDGFGYTALSFTPDHPSSGLINDAGQLRFRTDISTTGRAVMSVTADDDAELLLRKTDLSGFTFSFYGRTYNQVILGSNGQLTFEWDRESLGIVRNNSAINGDLTGSPQVATIAPFWDDLEILTPGAVYWQVLGSGSNQQLVIQFHKVRFWGSSQPGEITFQAILNESDNTIQFNYLDLDNGQPGAGGTSATVGIKDVGSQGANRLVLALNNGPNAWVGTGISTKIGKGIAPQVLTPDYYAFTLGAGQRATLALRQVAGNVDLNLLDATGNPVAASLITRPAAGNWDDVIEFAGSAGGTYYAAVVNGTARAKYNLVVTKGAAVDLEPNSGPAPWNGDAVQAVPLVNNQAVVLGAVAASSGGSAVVGYYTDNDVGTTGPTSAILAAGFVPVQITDISTFDLSTIDVLMLNEASNGGPSASLLGRLAAVQSWVELGGVLLVHDRFVTNDTADPQSNPLLVGAPGILLNRDLDAAADLDVIRSDTLVTNGPGGVVDNATLDGGTNSNHGYALEDSFPSGAISLLSAGPVGSPNHVAAFSYPLQSGAVYYATIPLDFYMGGSNSFDDVYAPNALAYAHSLQVPEADFYKVVVPALSSGGQLQVSTLTPGDGSDEPSGPRADLVVRLYDAAGNLVAADDNGSGDGRNALLEFPLTPAMTTRDYYVQVAAAPTLSGLTRGAYVASLTVSQAPPPAGITINKTSLVTREPNLSDSFTVVLNAAPTANVKMDIAASDTTEGLVSATLVFTASNWNIPQTVTVVGADDAVDDGDIPYTIIIYPADSDDGRYVGMKAPDVAATNIDNDQAGITISPTSGLTTSEGSSTLASFLVKLDSEPLGSVTIPLSSSDLSEGTLIGANDNLLTLTFNAGNWSQAQTVQVRGVDDVLLDRNMAYTIVTAAATSGDPGYNGINPGDVSVVNLDNETATFVTIENFEDRSLSEYTTIGDPGVTITKQSKHDGSWGLRDAAANGWMYRADMAVQVQRGQMISFWASRDTLAGQSHMGFGASAGGTYSIVMAANTGSLVIQKNAAYGFASLTSVPQSWQANHWYRFEVDWQSGGVIVGRLFDSDGVTLLNAVSATDSTITSGGIAFRAYDGNTYFDTVQRVAAQANQLSLSGSIQSAAFETGTAAGPEKGPVSLATVGGNDILLPAASPVVMARQASAPLTAGISLPTSHSGRITEEALIDLAMADLDLKWLTGELDDDRS